MSEVRDIHEGDQDAWRRLFLDYGVFYETDFSDTVLDGVWHWLMNAESPLEAVVAVEAGEVVGFAHYRALPDTFSASNEWYLDDLYVRPDQRGTGAGSALIEAVAERASSDGGGTLRWITAADNTAAQSVYDKLATRTTWVTYEKRT